MSCARVGVEVGQGICKYLSGGAGGSEIRNQEVVAEKVEVAMSGDKRCLPPWEASGRKSLPSKFDKGKHLPFEFEEEHFYQRKVFFKRNKILEVEGLFGFEGVTLSARR